MRHARLTALALAGVLGLSGCGAREQSGEENFKIVTTVFASYDLAAQLTENLPCEVTLLLTPGGESHAFEPTPGDAADILSCDLFVYIGGTSEIWAEKYVQKAREDKPSIRLFDAVEPIVEKDFEGMEEEPEEEEEYDEHIWTAPRNAEAMLNATADAIGKLLTDGAQKAELEKRRGEIAKELRALDEQALDIRQREKRNTLVFADRFPFRYLTERCGWDVYAAFSGCTSDTDASPATLAALIEKVRADGISTVFYLDGAPTKLSDTVAKATGAKTLMLRSLNNVIPEDLEKGLHYQDLMKMNLEAIEEALC